MAIQPAQPQSIGGVLDTTFQLFKASVAKVLALCLIGAVGSVLPTIYAVFGTEAGIAAAADPMASMAMVMSPGYWLVNLATMILSLVSMAAIYLKMQAIGTGGDMSTGEAFTAGLRKVPMLFLTMLLFIIALCIGYVLLVIPGIILTVSLMMCFALVIFEDKGAISALTGSHKLVWGDWWRTLVILSVGFILVFVVYMALGLVLGVVIGLAGMGSDNLLLFTMLSSVVVAFVASLVLTPFYVGLAIALYWDLKLRKEGGDLAARVGALGTA